MAARAPKRALCLQCCEIKTIEYKPNHHHFDRVVNLPTAGMLQMHRLETVTTESPKVKDEPQRKPRVEKLWARKIKDEDKLQPVNFGVGPCQDCRNEDEPIAMPDGPDLSGAEASAIK